MGCPGSSWRHLDIELHKALGHELHHTARHVDVGSLLGEFGKCHSGGGHRGVSFGGLVGRASTISGTTMATPMRVAVAARQAASGFALRALPRLKTYTTSWDITARPGNGPEKGRLKRQFTPTNIV